MYTLAHPLKEKWWHEAQYQRSLDSDASMEQIDSALNRVAEVFDEDWCGSNTRHPVSFQIHSRGLNPLRFLSTLGQQLISVATCLRHQQLIEDLKRADHFSSAYLELFVASKLQEHGHCVELRPKLPNEKNADILTKEDGLGVFWEIKQLSPSDARKAVEQLSQELLFSVARLQASGDTWPKEAGYEIVISERTLDSLGAGDDSDQALTAELIGMMMTEMNNRLQIGELPFEFNIRSYLNVRVGIGLTPRLSGPVFAPEPELKRVLQKHFKEPNRQLYPERPGILLIQSAAALDPLMTRKIVERLLEKQPVHLSVVVFISVFPPDSMAYVFFPSFAVENPRARFPAKDLKAFQSICRIFNIVEPPDMRQL